MRVLRPETIIPPNLYVERAADRQVQRIIDDMGRPGYVLVARQMGKTNLLLNARRRLTSDNLFFVYSDLSIKIESLEEFYADLISKLGEAYSDRFGNPQHDISSSSPYRASYREFESALRNVLKSFSGRVVFILDEIDALQSYPFGAKILSHIRSLYFAGRANYAEFSRMTFLLSGVAEPADLIKDKNVSPFNIGEKIYLNDFSRSEFNQFIAQTGLPIEKDVANAIFEWVGGNPRMTWDVLSELEASYLLGKTIDDNDVHVAIHKLYLDSFDTAPVDHIRSLASTDREIRQALIAMRSEPAAEVPDKIKSKMYLSGIISLPDAKSQIKIKNKVIDHALSMKWLEDVGRLSRSAITLARESYDDGRYEAAVAYYEEFQQANDLDVNSSDAYKLASSYFQIGRYTKAGEWLQSYVKQSGISDAAESAAQYRLGLIYQFSSKYDQALDAFNRVIALGQSISHFGAALTNKALILLKIEPSINADAAIQLSEQALLWLDRSRISAEQPAATRSRAYGNIALAHEASQDLEKSENFYIKAIEYAEGVYKVDLIMRLIGLDEDKHRFSDHVTDIVDGLNTAIEMASRTGAPDVLLGETLELALIHLRLSGFVQEFESLVGFAEKHQQLVGFTRPTLLLYLFDKAFGTVGEGAVEILTDIITNYQNDLQYKSEVRSAAKQFIISTQSAKWADVYLELFAQSQDNDDVDAADYLAFSFLIYNDLQAKDRNAIFNKIALSERLLQSSKPHMAVNYALILFYKLQAHIIFDQDKDALQAAIQLRDHLESHKNDSSAILQVGTIEKLVQNAENYIQKHMPKERIVNPYKEIGRNTKLKVRYMDGLVLTDKFKKLQRDLVLGKCVILRIENEENLNLRS